MTQKKGKIYELADRFSQVAGQVIGTMKLKAPNLSMLLFLAVYSSSLMAQSIYKWVDDNGVVHFGDTVPLGTEVFERVTLMASPAATAAPDIATEDTPVESQLSAPAESGRVNRELPASLPETIAISEMSIEALNARCEDAREAAIAPLRDAAIQECKVQNPRNDPGYCDRFYATFGDAVRLADGRMSARMFDDLPECLAADAEWRRRSLE
jgi:hypothetical protein